MFIPLKKSVNENRILGDKIRGKIGFLEDEKETWGEKRNLPFGE
jgi:hypothetical protein